MNPVELVFTLNLLILAADHLYTGVLALFFPTKAVKAYAKLFGAHLPETREYRLLLKPWGALGIFAGLVGVLPIFDPPRYILVLGSLVALLLLRIIYRVRFQKDAALSLKMSPSRNLFHLGLITVCASIIVAQIIFYT